MNKNEKLLFIAGASTTIIELIQQIALEAPFAWVAHTAKGLIITLTLIRLYANIKLK